MIQGIKDKLLIIVLTIAAIVLIAENVTAIHVCVVLGAIIIAALDVLFKNRALPFIFAALSLIAVCFTPYAVFMLPMAIYVLTSKNKSYEFITAIAAFVVGLIASKSYLEGTLLFMLSAVAAYISFYNNYYHDIISRSTVAFDEARKEASDSARKRRELREKTDSEIYTARLKERNRIAREIHDNVGHQITRVIVQMQAIKIINKDPNVGAQLDSVSETLDLAMTGIRRSVHELHDDSIDLAIGINDIAKTLPSKFKVDVSTSIESPADNDTKNTILGIIKEAVTNIAKHSSGDKVKIEVVENISFWRIFVHDNGNCPTKEYDLTASTSDGHGIGLGNIADRATSAGGRASIRSSSSGFEVLATIPKKEKN